MKVSGAILPFYFLLLDVWKGDFLPAEELRQELARFIKERTTQASFKTEREALHDIQVKTDEITEKTDKLLKPFTTLSKWVTEIFQYQGIKLTDNLRESNQCFVI